MSRLLAIALLLGGCAAPMAVDDRAPRVIGVSAVGRVAVRPDTALVHIGAEARAPALADATADVDRRMREVLARVKALGVAEADIATATYTVDPLMAPRSREEDPARIAGYRVANVAEVRVRDLAAVGRILDAAMAAGANTLPSLQLTVHDRSGPESRARVLAVRAAAAKAAQIAAAAGVRLGDLVLLSEGGGVRPVMQQARYTSLSLNAPGPVEPGQLEVEVAVEAQYLIEK
jgi:uncharacterized protein YggE